MTEDKIDISEEQKNLVLARLNTLNPDLKLMLGSDKKVSVKDLITHVENEDQFGKKIIQAQMTMLKVLAGSM